eukprot:m.312527 g.312527  ORF g.312527 m.312527 type:complete len:52 (+) comp277483_c0_seq1:217-372(+)
MHSTFSAKLVKFLPSMLSYIHKLMKYIKARKSMILQKNVLQFIFHYLLYLI